VRRVLSGKFAVGSKCAIEAVEVVELLLLSNFVGEASYLWTARE
jgi:hypothetical protein